MLLRLLLLAPLVVTTGCTHVQLRKNAINQAGTVGDIHQQQVLNNLAMFVYDYNSMPSFSYPNLGGTSVTDQGSAGLTTAMGRTSAGLFLLSAMGLNLNAQRQAQEGFTVTPINDPRRLELMRCAYQQAVSNCGRGHVSQTCPDCKTRFNTFYTGDPNGDIRAAANGVVTSECLKPNCWFHTGCKKCVPKDCNCNYVGHYCGVYVWVLPEGRDGLTKLTLTILDYAIKDAPVRRNKTVEYYIDEYGLPTTNARSVGKVTAQVAINEDIASLLSTSRADKVRIEQIIDGRINVIHQQLGNELTPEARKQLLDELQTLQNKREYLREQLGSGGLRDQFYPAAPGSSAAPGFLPFNLYQNTLTPAPR